MTTLALSVDLLRRFLDSLKYHHDDAADAWHILGLRSAEPVPGSPSIALVEEQSDPWSDTVVVFGTRGDGQPLCQCYLGSIDAGLPSTPHPSSNTGDCSHLLNGQYRYIPGVHEGYSALVQDSKVKIWRDADRHLIRDGKDAVQSGYFGIPIHAGGIGIEGGRSPACGCVLSGGQSGSPWRSFMELMTFRPRARFWFSLVDAADLHGFVVYGAGNIDPAAPEFPGPKRHALHETLRGIAMLYAYQDQAALGAESGVTFLALLNRLHSSGVLANIRLQERPRLPAVPDRNAARTALIGALRRIYQHMLAAGLDHTFHGQLDQLRHFGPLGGL